jgi:TetR/AcrR family transcriptional regulator, cholesterol catabolism regulator
LVIAVVPRRRAIEDVASALFRERGYAATSVRDIARALDIRGASLYAHVTSKEDVLWAIVDRAATAFEAAADAVDSGTPAQAIRGLVRAHVGVITTDPELASVFVHEWRHLSGERRQRILDRRDAYEARFRAVVDRGVRDGSFRATDPALATTFLLTALNGLAAWYRPHGRLTAAEIAERYADLAARSLTEDAR